MPHSLPPLNALRAFEASARLLSFKKASEELSVTPSAVSQQIKNLEDYLGVVLFHRSTHGLDITKEGKELLPSLEKAFADIAHAVSHIKNSQKTVVRITSMPTFSANWLGPKIKQFEERYPDIALSLHSSLEVNDISKGEYDCAIRAYLQDSKPSQDHLHLNGELIYEYLFDSELLCVCNPRKIVNKAGKAAIPKKFEDLVDFNLIHFKDYNTWSVWMRFLGPMGLNANEGIICNDIDSLLRNIHAGQGVGIIDRELANHPIYSQNFEQIFEEETPGVMSFYFVMRAADRENIAITTFRKWLIANLQSMQGHYVFDQSRRDMLNK